MRYLYHVLSNVHSCIVLLVLGTDDKSLTTRLYTPKVLSRKKAYIDFFFLKRKIGISTLTCVNISELIIMVGKIQYI